MLAAHQRERTLSHAVFPQQTLVRHASLVIGASLVLALSARVSIHLPIGPVPITGQTFAVLLIGALLGPRLGALAAVLYVAEGIANLPVYAGGAHGWAVITGSTGGYLLSYPVAAFVVGSLAQAGWDRRPWTLAAAMLAGEAVIYAFGLPWLYAWGAQHEALINTNMTASLTLQWGLVPFIPGDVAKLLLAAALVPAGWEALRAVRIGPARVLGNASTPSSANWPLAGVAAGLAMAVSAVLPWSDGGIGLEQGAGWVLLAAGLAGALGAWLRQRGRIGGGVAQLWGFVAAAAGGLVAFVHLVTFTAGGTMALADAFAGVVLAMVASLVLLAFAAAESSVEDAPARG